MDRGSKVIELRQNRAEEAPSGAGNMQANLQESLAEQVNPAFDPDIYDAPDDSPPAGRWRRPMALALCLGGGVLWLTLLGYQSWAKSGGALSLDMLIDYVIAAAAPLAMLGVLWLVLMRSSRAEADGFAQTRAAMEEESKRLEALLAFVSSRIDTARQGLNAQGESLMHLGEDAAQRLSAATQAMGREIETITGHADALKNSAATTRGDLAILMSNLPKTQVQMRNIANALVEAGNSAMGNAKSLSAEVLALGMKAQDARGIAQDAVAQFNAHFQTLSQTAADMQALIAQNQQALAEAGAGAGTALAQRMAEIGQEVDRIGSALSAHEQMGTGLIASVQQGLVGLDQQFAVLEDDVRARATKIGQLIGERVNEEVVAVDTRLASFETGAKDRADRLGLALGALRNHADDLRVALEGGSDAANGLSEKTESLLTALDAAAREIDETIPAAYARLEANAGRALASANAVAPLMASLSSTSEAMAERVAQSDQSLQGQRDALDAMAAAADARLAACQTQARDLVAMLSSVNDEAGQLSRAAGTELLDVLSRTRDVAQQAVAQSREALSGLIPETALALGKESREMLSVALTEEIETQMAGLSGSIEKAVSSAETRMAQMETQLRTLGQVSAALEARIEAAQDESDKRDHTHFARRVALLIESLNSTAIDVTKILSNDVTDSAWASYMRGDRGVFSRRAVKLLDNSEAREIARHYQDDPEFREQVNRYIHDYESMLRNVMATREGTPLSVALLSADTGKLYVALAQAIERLRS